MKHLKELHCHLEAVQKIQTVLSYPESLTHEVRRAWPELQLLLRGVHRYFSQLEVETDEFNGLENYSRGFATLIAPWLQSPQLPSRVEIERFTFMASELTHHLAHHAAELRDELAREQLSKKRAG